MCKSLDCIHSSSENYLKSLPCTNSVSTLCTKNNKMAGFRQAKAHLKALPFLPSRRPSSHPRIHWHRSPPPLPLPPPPLGSRPPSVVHRGRRQAPWTSIGTLG